MKDYLSILGIQIIDEQCSKCGKIVRTNRGRDRHTQLYCGDCQVCLPERTSFDIHMGVQHGSSRKEDEEEPIVVVCELCNQSFKTLVDAEWHEVTEHDTGVKPRHVGSKCRLCDN